MQRDFAQITWDAAVEEDARQLIRLAVREDLERQQDWTTVALVAAETVGRADVVARAPGIVAGLPVAKLVLEEMDQRLAWRPVVEEGAPVVAGQTLATVSGPARSLLTAERPLLNFVGRLSGVATLARRYVAALAGAKARVYDTRKTTPGWRRLEKYAARLGGATNHRTGLFDAILIKDNHLALGATRSPEAPRDVKSHSPARAVELAREFLGNFPAGHAARAMLVEVEVDTLDQLRQALASRPDIILLDNMSLLDLRAAVALRDAAGAPVELEASGGVSLTTLGPIAQTGVERVSVGAMTHSAAWLDVGLDWR